MILPLELENLSYDQLIEIICISINEKNNLDEIAFSIIMRRLINLNEELTSKFFKFLNDNLNNQYFISRVCDLPFFVLHFNELFNYFSEKSKY